MHSYPHIEGTRCKKDYKVNKKKKLCVSTKIPAPVDNPAPKPAPNPAPVPKPVAVPSPVVDWYPHVQGTRCKKGYKVNKTLKRCVSTKSPKPAPAPAPAPKPVPVPAPKPGQHAIPVNISFPGIKNADNSTTLFPPTDSALLMVPNKSASESREQLFRILTELFKQYSPYADKSLRVQYNFVASPLKEDFEKKRRYLGAGIFTSAKDIPMEAVTLGPNNRLYIRVMAAVDAFVPAPPPVPVPVYVPSPPPPGPKPPEPIQQIIQIARTGNKCPATFSYNKTTKMCEKCPDGTRKVRRTCVLLPSDDKDDVLGLVPAPPIVLPKPPPANGESLVDFLHRMEDTGKKIQDPIYTNGRYMVFIYIYLIKKYAASCSIFNDPFMLHGASAAINYNIKSKTLTSPINLAQQMKECVLRGSELIFITLYMFAPQGAHVNILIYRPFKKIIERYEPHGQETGWGNAVYSEYDLNKQLKELFELRVQPVMKEYTPVFRTPYEVCPMNKNGFQGIENLLPKNKKEAGYCQLWTMFMMESILLNPTLNTQAIIEECIDIGKNDAQYFKNLIRGYTQQIAREIKLYLKQINADIGTQEGNYALQHLNIEDLVNETMAETKRQNKPLPPLGVAPESLSLDDVKELEKKTSKLNGTILRRYFNFIQLKRITQFVTSGTVKEEKERLLKTMLSRALKWDTLMDNIYNTYFTELSPLQIRKQDFFVRFKYYLPHLDLSTVPTKNRMELMAEAKAKYPNWHTYYETIQLIEKPVPVFGVKDKEKVDADVKKLKPKQVSELLYLLEYTLPSKTFTGPMFDKKTEKERVISLTKKLKEQNLHVINLQHWMSMF
jgi:hypothetical protein